MLEGLSLVWPMALGVIFIKISKNSKMVKQDASVDLTWNDPRFFCMDLTSTL